VGGGATRADALSSAVFLDRDGTIVRDRHFLSDPDELELLPRAGEGLRRLRDLGALLVVVTNQSGVARGYFDEATVKRVNARLRELLRQEGVELAGVYVCSHGPDDGCDCRKPAPGLLLRAASDLGIDLTRSFVLGDRASDVGAARAVGATPIRIAPPGAAGAATAADLVEAAGLVAEAWRRLERSTT
jgi:D-glycero-D-manno-heptose 1,7-bisphosphate phosphatase